MSVLDGATFALDAPARVPAVWGTGSRVLWAQGEPALIVKPDGVGGTTLAQQLALRRAGVRTSPLLGLPVAPDDRRVLYLALDRPAQARRSLARMVGEEDREALARQLVVWSGPLAFDVLRQPAGLLELACAHGAGTVVIDSLKDLAPSLSDEHTGQAINSALQRCVAEGVEVGALHHQRKAQAENRKPRALADVYGSRWLTAGAGSVLMLWGEAGDPVVELHHLKQPSGEVGPLMLLHDHATGMTTVTAGADVVDVLGASAVPLDAREVARRLFNVRDPQRNDIAKAKRRLSAAVAEGRARRVEPEPGSPALWALPEGVHARVHGGCTQGVHARGAHRAPIKGGVCTPLHAGGEQGRTEPNGAGPREPGPASRNGSDRQVVELERLHEASGSACTEITFLAGSAPADPGDRLPALTESELQALAPDEEELPDGWSWGELDRIVAEEEATAA
jgi:replicative DNA helicase